MLFRSIQFYNHLPVSLLSDAFCIICIIHYNTDNTFVNKIWTDLQLSVQKRMCKAHSRAERGRLRQTTSLRECASSARSAFFVIGNSIGFSYYKKRLPCEWHRTAVSSVVLIKLLYICCKFSQKTFRTMHRTHYEKPGKIQPPEVLKIGRAHV